MITDKHLEMKTLYGYPLIEGKITTDNMEEIYQDIITRREEIYPGCMDVEKDEDFNYIKTDWATYHDYVCMQKFPDLQFLFPTIVECLDKVNADPKDFYFKSWINIWPKGQSINPHVHYGEWHGYWVIKDTGTHTYYASQWARGPEREITALKNFDGHYVFMPGDIPHWAQKNQTTEFRVSMGFNISSWSEVLREEQDNGNNRGPKIRNVVLPLKDYL